MSNTNTQNTTVITSDESFAPVEQAVPVAAANEPEKPVDFTDEAKDELAALQKANRTVGRIEVRGKQARAAVTRRQWKFADTYGSVSINAFAKAQGFTYEASNLVRHVTAQLLLDINVGKEANKAEREALQNAVRPLAYALAVMDSAKAEHEHLSDAEFYDWFANEGHISGLRDRYLREKREGTPTSNTTATEAPASTSEKVEAMLANPAAQLVDAIPGIIANGPGLMVYAKDGDKVRLVPLTVTLEQLAQLAGNVPNPLLNAPRDLLFHRQMLMAGVAFVPDGQSNVTREDVPEGDEVNDTYSFENAFGMYLVERGHISIAAGRTDDGLIVEVTPRQGIDLRYSLSGDKFMNNTNRRRALEELTGEANAADYAASAADGAGYKMTSKGQKTTLTFTQTAGKKRINLIVGPREMGGVWTYRVSSNFAPIAQAVLDGAGLTTFMKQLAKKAPDERAVSVEVTASSLRLANGKAAAMPINAATTGAAKVRVMHADIKHALNVLLDLPLVGDMTWKLDPNGLMSIEASTDVATYRVHIQTLEENRDTPVRSRALRERVESLPKADAKLAA